MDDFIRFAEARLEAEPDPEKSAMLDQMKKSLAIARGAMTVCYQGAHNNARQHLAAGDDVGMVRSKTLEEALSAWPDAPFDSPLTKPIHDGIEDAIAGRPAREGFDPSWDLNYQEGKRSSLETTPTPEQIRYYETLFGPIG